MAAGATEGATSILNIASDPFGNMIGPAIARVGGTLYDAGARLTGLYPAMTPEQRADLYGQTPVDPAQQPLGTRVVSAIDQAIPGRKMADIQPETTGQEVARKLTGAAVAGGATGGPGAAIVATGGALGGDVASRVVPDWLAPGAELAGNYAGGKATQKVVTPIGTATTAERDRQVGMLGDEGIPLSAGERTGSGPLKKTEQILSQAPGSAGAISADVQAQKAAINRAVARKAGLDTDTLTPDVLNGHLDNVGSQIGQIASSNNMQLPTPFIQQLGQLRQSLRFMKTEAAQEIEARLNQLNSMITVDPATGNPVIAGPHYRTLMSDLREAITGADGTARGSMIQFRDMLRQQMEASMKPEDAARWRELNRQYANGMVIQHAMGAAGAGPAEGNISLPHLRTAIKDSLGSDAYAKGYGDLNDLARAGQGVLRTPIDSGSPQGIQINRLLNWIGSGLAAVGGATGAVHGGVEGGIAGVAAPVLAPLAINTVMRGRIPGTNYSPGQEYLANRLARDISPAMVAGLLNSENEDRQRNTMMRGYPAR